MTAAELIVQLQELPPKTPVLIEGYETGFDAVQLILFGSRPRGDYHEASDVDVAVILAGQPGDFVNTKLEMAGLAFDVLLETGVLIQALPVREC